jgi:hypothetical protein
MHNHSICFLASGLMLPFFSVSGALAQGGTLQGFDRYDLCIGDVCPAPGTPGAAPYKFDCGFARANPTNTDEQAAKKFCIVDQESKNYTRWDHVRYNLRGGGACGALNVYIFCGH